MTDNLRDRIATSKLSFSDGVDCQRTNEWCSYREPHGHGSFACDATCPCREAVDG